MFALEQLIVQLLLRFTSVEALNTVLRDPRSTAVLIGGLIALCGALLGTFLLLRGKSLTTDAISHTILLGIVVAFLVMLSIPGMEPDLDSPWLLVGAAAAGVVTVLLTELIQRSGLVRADAALGLAFPLLFALSILLIARYLPNVHIDVDSVTVGEIGVAWAHTNSHCLEHCQTVTITPDSPLAQTSRQCTNCRELGINPRDPQAQFAETCSNCGTFSPAQAYQAGLIETEPLLVFWPKSITVMAVMALLTVAFVLAFYKELKLMTFDAPLAQSLGLRPGALSLTLMVLVSLVAVGAFDAVGSILVIAFFIIPPAAAYLLTDRLSLMLIIAPVIGVAGAFFGYDLASGSLFGIAHLDDLLATLNRAFGLSLPTEWDSSISASMVLMMFVFFVLAWVFSPHYGLISVALRRADQRRRFNDQVVLAHIWNHQYTEQAAVELTADDLYAHFRWSKPKMTRVLAGLRLANLIDVSDDLIVLTPRGESRVKAFREQNLAVH